MGSRIHKDSLFARMMMKALLRKRSDRLKRRTPVLKMRSDLFVSIF
jgi:hypothetical protein